MKSSYLEFLHGVWRDKGLFIDEVVQGYIYEIGDGEKSFKMCRIDTGLNDSTSQRIGKSKAMSSGCWEFNEIDHVSHKLFLNKGWNDYSAYFDYDGNVMEDMTSYADQLGYPVVMKPDDGGMGVRVYLIGDEDELLSKADEIFNKNENVTISPYYECEYEYRVVVLGDSAEIAFRKERTNGWKHNLNTGSLAVDIDGDIKDVVSDLAVKASRSIGLTFCAVDILATKEGFKVLECNTLFSLNKYMQGDEKRMSEVATLYDKAIDICLSRC